MAGLFDTSVPRSSLHFSLEGGGLRSLRTAASSIPLALAVSLIFFGVRTEASNCNGTSTGFITLMDPGSGTYEGFEGGLYPGGSDLP